MAGGPSHLETLDYKPRLAEMHGQPMPVALFEAWISGMTAPAQLEPA